MGCLGVEGLRILVTASSAGIGFGIASVLSSQGSMVAVNSRSPERAEKAAEAIRKRGGKAWGVAADLSRPGEASRLVESAARILGGLDGLVYVPPPPPPGPFEALSQEEWLVSARLLVHSAVEAVKASLPYLEASGRGSIVFVTSIAAWEADPAIASSSVLRPSLHGLTQTLARSLAPRGIRVNAVIPGYILTERLRGLAEQRALEAGSTVDEELRKFSSSIPMRRIGSPEEVGWVVAFLLSPRASYVTGAAIPVDGGLHKRTP